MFVVGLVLGGATGAWFTLPGIARDRLAERGVTVRALAWCEGARPWAPAVCVEEAVTDGVTVASARWDARGRRVALSGVRVAWERAKAEASRGGARGATPAGGGSVRAWVDEVTVRGLELQDAPVALPPLEGTLYPTPSLRGEGVSVEGREVALRVGTEWGEVRVRAEPLPGTERVRVGAEAPVLTYASPSLGDAPLVLRDVRAEGDADPVARTFVGHVEAGGVRADVDARWTDDGPWAHVTLAPTPIADVYTLLASIVPEVAQARIEGTVSLDATGTLPDGPFDVQPVLEGFRVRGLVGPEYARGTISFPGLDATGAPTTYTVGDDLPGWTPLAAAGRWLPDAVILSEDGLFRRHPGFSLSGMLLAAEENAEAGKIRRGGSSLTQQLAKNLFLDGRRTYARKLRELLYAVDMETTLGKDRILELYLNVVEFGPGIRGVTAAADTYFARSPGALLPEEAAWLASILPMPRPSYHDQYRTGTPDLRRARELILPRLPFPDEDARADALARTIRFVPPPAR